VSVRRSGSTRHHAAKLMQNRQQVFPGETDVAPTMDTGCPCVCAGARHRTAPTHGVVVVAAMRDGCIAAGMDVDDWQEPSSSGFTPSSALERGHAAG
jgi:hypothetical protein